MPHGKKIKSAKGKALIKKRELNFLSLTRFFTPLSVGLSVAALIVIARLGFLYGIDFSGGNEAQVQFQQNVTAEQIRQALAEEGLRGASVQKFGQEKEYLIRIEVSKDEEENKQKLETLSRALKSHFQQQGVEIRRMDSIGPQIGKELRRNGILALIYSLLMILIYLGLRFDSKYAPSAVFCLFHDAVITMSIFSLFKLEVNTQTLAAILAIIGYSLNDTIVTFDRIRENHQLFGKRNLFLPSAINPSMRF